MINTCILAFLLSGADNYPFDKFPNELLGQIEFSRALRILQGFRQLANELPNGKFHKPLPWEVDPIHDSIDNHGLQDRDIFFSRQRTFLSMSKDSGAVLGAGVSPPEDKVPTFGQEDCVNRARSFFKILDLKYDLELKSVIDQPENNEYLMIFRFKDPNSKYWTGGGIETFIERTLAAPHYMLISYPMQVQYPSVVLEPDKMREVAAAVVSDYTGWKDLAIGVAEPRYEIPSYEGLPNQMKEKHAALVASKTGCLIYEVSVNDASSLNPETKRYENFTQVYVDAETGEVIALLPAYAFAGAHPKLKFHPFEWDSKEYKAGKLSGTIKAVYEATPRAGKRVVLQHGDKTIVAMFNPTTNRIWVTDSGHPVVGIVSSKLSRALQMAPALKEIRLRIPNNAKGSRK